MATPISSKTLKNGWVLAEYDDPELSVFVGKNSLPGSGSGRFTFEVFHWPASHKVSVVHFQGSTAEERAHARRMGLAVALGRDLSWIPWDRRRKKDTQDWYFSAVLGEPINEAEEFERLRRGLLTDDAVDIEFSSIIIQNAEAMA